MSLVKDDNLPVYGIQSLAHPPVRLKGQDYDLDLALEGHVDDCILVRARADANVEEGPDEQFRHPLVHDRCRAADEHRPLFSLLARMNRRGADVGRCPMLTKDRYEECCSLCRLAEAHVIAEDAPSILAVLVVEEAHSLPLVRPEILGNVRGNLNGCAVFEFGENEGNVFGGEGWVIELRPLDVPSPHLGLHVLNIFLLPLPLSVPVLVMECVVLVLALDPVGAGGFIVACIVLLLRLGVR